MEPYIGELISLSIPQYKVPTIYVFTLPFYKNAKWEEGTREGKGILKIGYTEQEDEQDRIRQQFPTLMPDNPETLLVRTAVLTSKVSGLSGINVGNCCLILSCSSSCSVYPIFKIPFPSLVPSSHLAFL